MAPRKISKRSRPIFAGLVFVVSGDFGPKKSHLDIERYITIHGGRVDPKVSDETTHLICTEDDYKKRVTHVKDALKLGKAKCKIVDFYFIDFCLNHRPRPKLISEKPYLLAECRKEKKIEMRIKDRQKKKIVVLEQLADPKLHHIYKDTEGFEYNITLAGNTSTANGKILPEKYTISLFESNAYPYTYMVGSTSKIGNKPTILYREKCLPKKLHQAMEDFRDIFRMKTGGEWGASQENIEKGGECFVYVPGRGRK